jgi:hypothetical protein
VPKKDFVLLVSDKSFGEPSLMTSNVLEDTAIILNLHPDFRSKKMKEEVLNMVNKAGVVWS